MKLRIVMLVCFMALFAFMMTPNIEFGTLTTGFGIEQAYGKPKEPKPKDPKPGNGGTTTVPEPSTLILLGAGLASVAGYKAYKSRKKK